MKYISKLSVRIVVAVAIGFLFAGIGTHITYSCPLTDGAAGCVSLAKAVDHPNDLLHNKQDSLTHFSEIFIITSLSSFAILSIFSLDQKRKPKPASQLKD